MSIEPELLFVYGTLRPGSTPSSGQLTDDLASAGPATVQGMLYDLGGYPGLAAGDGLVHGELLRIPDRRRLESLDRYEECGGPSPLFRREITRACRRDGCEVAAWIYVYARPVAGAPRIESGDYGSWLGDPRGARPAGPKIDIEPGSQTS